MKISDVLAHKSRHTGSDVVTTTPGGSVRDLLELLAEQGIGAVVVVAEDRAGVVGIVSERDVVRRLGELGAALLELPVEQIMTRAVVSCAPDDDLDGVAATMTDRHIRHMPVIDGGTLAGLVSIGDVVFSRIHQLEVDRGQLEQYITG
jgi:CBS domain-containing protein